jgi:hypothetical protein
MIRRHLVRQLVLAALFLPAAALSAQELARTSCVLCHGDADMFEEAEVAILDDFGVSSHAAAGLSCHDCHGGNPDPRLADDLEAAMDPDYGPAPYVAAPDKDALPEFCGRCHSDSSYIRRFRPDARIDQEEQYWTSRHGIALAAGDTNVATCTDCHGSHDIRAVTNPSSRVYPTKVAETCARCHSDAERMAGYSLSGGRPVPTDQYGLWRHSVHARSMFERDDLSAPTCNDCHGNHGAAPPGVESVTYVCGQCHGREAQLFRSSPKQAAFTQHNEYLEGAGDEGCAACHDSEEPQANLSGLERFIECSTCHGNHGVLRPTVALLAPLPETPCLFCHEPFGEVTAQVLAMDTTQGSYEELRDELLLEAERQGLSGDARFDWLVSQTLELPLHILRPAGAGEDASPLRPEFSRLFDKFRIGRTMETFEDPLTGEPVTVRVRRCTDCHWADADEAVGAMTAQGLLDHMRELTVLIASAERVMLAARRGGVEVRDGLAEIDQAINDQIQLEALVHNFSNAEDSQYVAKHREGIEHAQAAIDVGYRAVDELAFRRKGLAVSLLIIALVLVTLGIKIRELQRRSLREAEAAELNPEGW